MLLDMDRPETPAKAVDTAFHRDVIAGLSQARKAIPARWFYDHRGSQLFEEITQLPEYYPTRTERALLEVYAPEVARIAGTRRAVIEFGSGSSAKTPLLLSAIDPAAYVPIDISGEFLRESAAALGQAFPALPIQPVEADFTRPIRLPVLADKYRRLGFFPGSTIGNLSAPSAVDLLRAMAGTLGEGSMLLIGMDRVKSPDVLVPAYDDAQGVTAAFNLNLLHRINGELGADIPVSLFRHRAIWNDGEARIEMHLEALRDLAFTIDGERFAMAAGETIHTENSHKYGPRSARQLLASGGWTTVAEWTDPQAQFALLLAEARPIPIAP